MLIDLWVSQDPSNQTALLFIFMKENNAHLRYNRSFMKTVEFDVNVTLYTPFENVSHSSSVAKHDTTTYGSQLVLHWIHWHTAVMLLFMIQLFYFNTKIFTMNFRYILCTYERIKSLCFLWYFVSLASKFAKMTGSQFLTNLSEIPSNPHNYAIAQSWKYAYTHSQKS